MKLPPHLSAGERKQVCEDLLQIIQADRLDELAATRTQMLRDARNCYSPTFLEVQLEADRIAKIASRLVCGPAEEWLDAAASALQRPSDVDVCVEAIRQVAEEVRSGWEQPEQESQQQPAFSVEVRIAKRKRGGR